ncbi:apolipoprotein N-acyltransferase [Arachidicoccus ginsenosidivorans]|uniref:Apolipoprotein N-acyltransferase n=1 Tax=Arachidicoccus ginsenosidivorans TaxID=496057 RepID=A0A5B8VJX7_9BACT|nr:apolipoprotein N-acyltransferase [Arachidicoccus ginsenosidivorans]QEC71272.1 apolipoprotein N-acyltransferase [Arachidicoccus ginsenosidivorans]
MGHKLSKKYWILLLSAIPITMSIQMADTPLNWIVYALVFYAFMDLEKAKDAFWRGALVGGVTAILNFFWIIGGAQKFTGKGVLIGIGITLIFTVIFALYAGILGWVILFLKRKTRYKLEWLVNGIYLASFWVLVDAFMIYFAKGFALCLFVSYTALAQNLYLIQLSTITGPLLFTFLVVFLSYITAYFVYYKKWKLLYIPVAVILTSLAIGGLILNSYENQLDAASQAKKQTSFKAAILSQNLDPQFRWDPENGNYLAQQLFKMNKMACENKAQLTIWSESAIPWNYTPDDDFLRVLDSLTASYNVTHLIGMNTDYDRKHRIFYNSIYSMEPGRKIMGRYDKRLALSLIEKPFMGMLIPFYNSTGFRVKEGKSDKPLPTPYGGAGILLCNESVIPDLSYSSVREGANFLVNPGNDGWFSHTYISKQHLYHARLRAVETRKDLLINNNDGYSGKIESSGRMPEINKGQSAMIGYATVYPNGVKTFIVLHPHWFALLCLIVFLAILSYNLIFVKEKWAEGREHTVKGYKK